MSASEQKDGGGAPACNACFAALRTNQFKIKPGTGKVAVFLNQRQIATALARTRKGESLDDQLFKLERQFQALGQALENRNKLMTKHHWRDGLSVVWH